MVNHPKRNKLAEYGGKIIETDGLRTVEMVSPNDNARRKFQYRRSEDGGLERRVLQSSGKPFVDTGSPWEQMSEDEIAQLHLTRGEYHPILDPLGLDGGR